MAFGKDRDALKKVTSLREAGNASRGRPRGGGGAGGWKRFQDQFKPNTVEPDTVRFLPGEYPYTQIHRDGSTEVLLLPYFVYTEHFDGRTNGSSICSGGAFADYKDKAEPCIGCDLFWENGGKKGGRMSRREMKAFTILNLSTFHEVDQLDYKTGQVKMNDRTNKPYKEWVKCTGRRCDACASGKPTKKGHIQHYSVGFGHFGQIKDYAKMIGKCCKSCGTRNSIDELAYICGNCKDAVIDMSTTHLSNEDIAKMVDGDVVCPHCRTEGLLEEIIQCSSCDNPERAGIFDVDISIKKVAGPEGTNQSTLMFTEFGPVCPVDPAFDVKPMDFEGMFAPTTLEQQAQKFKVPVPAQTPRQPVPASQVARDWNQGGTPPQGPQGGGGGMFNR